MQCSGSGFGSMENIMDPDTAKGCGMADPLDPDPDPDPQH